MQQRSFWQRLGGGLLGASLIIILVVGALTIVRGVQPQTNRRIVPSSTPVTALGALDPTSSPSPMMAATSAPTASSTPAATSTPAVLATAPNPAIVANVPNVRVSNDQFTAHSETSLTQNPRDPRNFVAASKMFTDNANYIFRIGTYASFDGGKTWIDNGQLPGLQQYRITSDPMVVFDGKGNAYAEVLAARNAQGHSAVYIYKSTDGGRTWSDPVLISNDSRGFNDKEWLTADTTGGPRDGTLYASWVQIVGDMYRILLARSSDSGATWSAPVELAATPKVTRQGPVVVVDAAGNVVVQWSNLTTSRFESSVSTDGGVTFGPVRTGLAFQNVRPLKGNLRRGFVLAAFAADPRTPNKLYTVWDDGRLGNADVLFSVSMDGGATWRDPVVVNGAINGDQFQPWVGANADGDVYVQWFDRRDDPQNMLVQTYAARSRDDGATWSELRVTDVASNPTAGLPMSGDAGFYGDYQSLVADRDGAQLFWNETRGGSQQIYTARVANDRWGAAYRVKPAGPVRERTAPVPEAEENGA